MSTISSFFPIGSGGGGLTWQVPQTTGFSAVNGVGYPVDTSTGSVIMTLPASPSAGEQIGYKDYAGTFSTNNLIINPNGQLVEGLTGDMVVSGKGSAGVLAYIDATKGWLVIDQTPSQTVQTKPMFQAQWQETTGTYAQFLAGGEQQIPLNTVLSNDISGTTLSSNSITLPAGEYYIDASHGRVASTPHDPNRLYIMDSNDNKLLVGVATRGYNTWQIGPMMLSGKITLTQTTTIKLSRYASVADAGSNLRINQSPYEVFADIKIWRLDQDKVYPNVQDPVIALTKPMMHVQDQKPSGTAAKTAVSNVENIRELNTVVSNNISGATLGTDEITLPAGKYYLECNGVAKVIGDNTLSNQLRVKDGSTTLLAGVVGHVLPATSRYAIDRPSVAGELTLTTETSIEIAHMIGASGVSFGSPISKGTPEVYIDVRIWQIDAVAQVPITRQPINTPITGAYTTGDVFGGELEWISGTQFNVRPVSCYSDDLTTPLVIDSTTLITLSSPTINTIYNVFLVKNDDLSFDILTDTDINGANLPVTVNKKRWLGFVTTASNGLIIGFTQEGDTITFGGLSTNVGTIVLAETRHSIALIVPVARVTDTQVGTQSTATGTSANSWLAWDINGVRGSVGDASYTTAGSYGNVNMWITGEHFWSFGNSASIPVRVQAVKLRR